MTKLLKILSILALGMMIECGLPALAQSNNIIVNFSKTTALPANNFGTNGLVYQPLSASNPLISVGMTNVRIFAPLDLIFANPSSPDYSRPDSELQQTKAWDASARALVVITHTPASLQPQTNNCKDKYNVVPTSASQWASYAATAAKHFERQFPGLVYAYEIWNEPDNNLCSSTGVTPDPNGPSDYAMFYKAAASAIRAISGNQIGGPVTVSSPSSLQSYASAIINAGAIVDFVSFHYYPCPCGNNDWPSYYSTLQSSNNGIGAFLTQAASLAGANRKIYVTEYNANWQFQLECCRNDPNYGPLWNSIFLIDSLGATRSFNQAFYFATNATTGPAGSYVCIVGEIDPSYDCATNSYGTYPQYMTYQMFGQTLNLSTGGSVSPVVTNTTGFPVLGVTSSAGLAIIVANPTANSATYSPLFENVANPPSTLTVYVIRNNSYFNYTIPWQHVSNGYTGTVVIGAYSTAAFVLQ